MHTWRLTFFDYSINKHRLRNEHWSELSSVHWRHVINVTSPVSGDTSRDSLYSSVCAYCRQRWAIETLPGSASTRVLCQLEHSSTPTVDGHVSSVPVTETRHYCRQKLVTCLRSRWHVTFVNYEQRQWRVEVGVCLRLWHGLCRFASVTGLCGQRRGKAGLGKLIKRDPFRRSRLLIKPWQSLLVPTGRRSDSLINCSPQRNQIDGRDERTTGVVQHSRFPSQTNGISIRGLPLLCAGRQRTCQGCWNNREWTEVGWTTWGRGWGANSLLYVETRPHVIWTGKNEYGRVEIWVDGWWTGKKSDGGKNIFQNHRYC